MKRTIAVILISLLVTPPAWADQKPGNPLTWEKAQKLKFGTEIFLTVIGGTPTKVKLLFADDSMLVTLGPDTPRLPRKVEETLLLTGAHWPDILYRGGSNTIGQVKVSKDGVFDSGQKVADLVMTPRGDVLAVSEPQHSHWIRNLAIAIAVGVAVLIVLFFTLPQFD